MKRLIAMLFLVLTVGLCAAELDVSALTPNKSMPLEQLIEILQSEDSSARSAASYCIGEQGAVAVDAVPALIERIEQDDTSFVIHSAVKALGRVGAGHDQTIPALFKVFRTRPSSARWYAAEGLTRIGAAAIPTLLVGTRSESVHEEMWSQITLAQIQGVESVHFRFVLDAFSSGDSFRSEMAMKGLAMMASALPSDSLPRLLIALDRDGADRAELLAIIAGMGARAAPAISQIIPLLDDPKFMVRLRAVQALGSIGGAEAAPAVPALIRLLDSDQRSLREYTAAALGAIGAEASAAIPVLIGIMNDDSQQHVRFYAAMALVQIDASETEVKEAFVANIKNPDDAGYSIANYLAQQVPPTREWIDIFLELYAQEHISERVLRNLYFRASPEAQKCFPPQLNHSYFD